MIGKTSRKDVIIRISKKQIPPNNIGGIFSNTLSKRLENNLAVAFSYIDPYLLKRSSK
jgi:hypothetical protein